MGVSPPPAGKNWTVLLRSGSAYAICAFIAGFGFGAIRLILVVPHLGETFAVLLETPIMLAVCWWCAHWITGKFHVAEQLAQRLILGGIGFLLLMSLEAMLSLFLFGRSMREFLESMGQVPGAIGLAGQLGFALIPLLQSSEFASRIRETQNLILHKCAGRSRTP